MIDISHLRGYRCCDALGAETDEMLRDRVRRSREERGSLKVGQLLPYEPRSGPKSKYKNEIERIGWEVESAIEAICAKHGAVLDVDYEGAFICKDGNMYYIGSGT